MALPTLDATFASSADLPRKQMLAKWLVEELGSGSIADYYDLPERYLWAKIAVAAGAPKNEADYISLPKNYAWSDIYNAVSGDIAQSTVVVSGLSDSQYNGSYVYDGEFNGKPSYRLNANISIYWEPVDNAWIFGNPIADEIIASDSNVNYPWLASNWYELGANGFNPTGLVITVQTPNHTDWSENVALGHIAAAYRGDTGNPANLATYIDWPWRYKVAAIIDKAIDDDVEAFMATSGATDRNGLNAFVKRIKALGLWNSMVCWPLRSSQNAGTGTTVYSLGGLGTYNGTLVNGPTWDNNGVDFASVNRRMQTSFSFSQPQTIFSVFTRLNIVAAQRMFGPLNENHLIRSSSGAIVASASNSVTVGSISPTDANKFYTSQIEFNGANSTSSFNGSNKIQVNLGSNNNSGFIIGSPDATRGALTSFVGIFSTTSMELIRDLYLETLGEGLPLP